MRTIYLDQTFAERPQPCVATIGFFDGVHRGHQFLIRQVMDEAQRLGLASMVVTFDRHPRQVLQSDYQPELLSTLDEKLHLLGRTGVDMAAVVHFDLTMASLSARDFMQKVLKNRLNVSRLIIGYDNRFGHNRAEGFDDYVAYGREMGIEVVRAKAFAMDDVRVSSSVVRALLRDGEAAMARRCLGYAYSIVGRVVHGFEEGRKMGFPTANLDTSGYAKLVPGKGVYAVKVRIRGDEQWHEGMMNIGTRPTFDGTQQTLEVNIFDYDGDLYGQTILVSFWQRIRGEQKFASEEALRAQLEKDKETIMALLG